MKVRELKSILEKADDDFDIELVSGQSLLQRKYSIVKLIYINDSTKMVILEVKSK